MSHPFRPRVGGVLSADIAVPDHAREVRFYSRVLTTGERPLWREDLMNREGVAVIGLGERTPEYAELPLQWMPHIQVADVAASVQRALELGGQELMHAQGDDGTSQWAVLKDPNGAAFGIIPVVSADEIPEAVSGAASEAVGVGCIAWLDLTVADAAATADFYQQVVGWAVEEVGMKDGGERYADYNLCDEEGDPVAGICHARGVNVGLPTIWLLYIPVGDLGESLRRVEEDGGKILKATRGSDGEFAQAVVQDPVGASLALSQG